MKRSVAIVLASLLVTGVAWSKKPKPAEAPAPAQQALTGDPTLAPIVRYRHVHMESLGKHMGLAKMLLDGAVARPADLVAHADALHAGSQDLVALFPAGTGPDAFETQALPAIWETPEEFAVAAAAFEQASGTFAEVARGGDIAASTAAFGEVGMSCGGCHKPFRKKDEPG